MTRMLSPLEKLAAEIAIIAPPERSKYAVNASVPWDIIENIRSELDLRDVDWRAANSKSRGARGRRQT